MAFAAVDNNNKIIIIIMIVRVHVYISLEHDNQFVHSLRRLSTSNLPPEFLDTTVARLARALFTSMLSNSRVADTAGPEVETS